MKCEGDHNGCYVTDIHRGDYIKVRGVDFGDAGATRFTAKVRAEKSCTLIIRIDSKSGTESVKARLTVEPTNGEWQEFTCDLTETITGLHDLFFTFNGSSDSKLDFDSWQFSDASTGIHEVENMRPSDNKTVFDLQGRRLNGNRASKGIRIVGGKKVVL